MNFFIFLKILFFIFKEKIPYLLISMAYYKNNR